MCRRPSVRAVDYNRSAAGLPPSSGGAARSVIAGLGLLLVLLAAGLIAEDGLRAAPTERTGISSFLRPALAPTDTVEVPGELSREDLIRIFGEEDPVPELPGRAGDLFPRDTIGGADTLGAAVLPDTGRAARLLPPFRRDAPTARLAPRRMPLSPPLGQFWSRTIELDSTETRYVVRERVGGQDVRLPATYGLDAFRDARLRLSIDDNFRELTRQRAQRQQQRAGVGIGFDIPGGAGRGLRSIFGSDQVDLRVNGQTNVNVGFSYRQNEQQTAATGRGGRVDPDFGQELGLSIIGTIGDKLEVNVNYDTQNDFDFQNQVRLTYTGYEDDIIQRIEAGNVFLPVESDLIRGGQRLFGLKTDLRIGGLGITAVASQQDAESSELTIEGGSQTTPFQLIPTQYEDNAHFYLGYHFYSRWDVAHSNPPNPVLGPVRSFENIEVFKFDISLTLPDIGDDIVAGVALLDLGEPVEVLQGGRAYYDIVGAQAEAPGPSVDRYTEEALDALRAGGFQSNGAARAILDNNGAPSSALGDGDLVVSRFKRLRQNQDYTVDETFGTISLNQPLNESDVLAVAYTYRRADGTTVRVGDVGQGSGSGNIDDGPRVVLKLLRPANMQPTDAGWDLTMRNIYRVGGRGLDPEGFELQIEYAGPGQTPQRRLPGVSVGQQQSLLQVLGLDRVNREGLPGSDDLFDFLPGFTIRPGTGRVIFPYREPLGQHMRRVLNGEAGVPVQFDGITREEAIERYVFDALYREKPETAARQTNKNVFRVTGSSRGTVQEFYDLGFAIVEGSVEVMSGGTRLTAGTDYVVDYATGTVNITNPAFLTPGRDIRINFERQQFVAIQKKTLLGLRALYEFTDRFAVGATWMRLTERPLIDKYRVGEEPIANSIWGLDARYEAEPQWMTRMVDAIPLVQTRAPSRFTFRGEFAQLNPGHPNTLAFDRSRDRLRDGVGRDFNTDELDGISYIDDFEGTENTFSLLQPSAWRLASGPTGDISKLIPGAGPDSVRTYLSEIGGGSDITRPGLRSNWRGLFGWYAVVPGAYESGVLAGLPRTNASRPIPVREVFPERDLPRGQPQVLTTLDVYFDPSRRGPYNFNADLGTTFSDQPEVVWGGMMQRLPDGYRDFEARNNIEFVEFIFSPFGGRLADEPIDPEARLFIDLGRVSEDVLPDGELNTEDGMLIPGTPGIWGRRGTGPTDGIININTATRRTEDLGLNGLPSGDLCRAATENGTPYDICEAEFYAGFLDRLRATLPPNDPRLIRAELDPAADDYRSFQDAAYFDDQSIWPGGAVLQERFSHFYSGYEGNSLEAQTQLAGRGTPGNSRIPDSEDLYLDGSLNTIESFFRYEIPLHPEALRNSPFYVETIQNEDLEGAAPWYVVRIPVRTEDRVAIGGIQGFREISAVRVWTQGHARPATMRFAKMELVGSQWLKSEEVSRGPAPPEGGRRDIGAGLGMPPNIFVASINTEQNPSRYRVPNGTIRSFTRDATSGDLIQNREAALVMLAENLMAGSQAALFKPYTRGMDLTRYSNLRMFVHGSGFEEEDDVRVFMRIGANETGDYYEIEQPLYPWEPPHGQTVTEFERSSGLSPAQVSDLLWQTSVEVDGQMVDRNSINVAFAALNILKVERDLARDPDDPSAPWALNRVYQKPVSDFEESEVGNFAPAGAVLSIRGTPSIQNISAIVMGIRRGNGGSVSTDAEVWFNELRVSGYDEQAGWSAYANAGLQLADFANLNVRYARQTDAFGQLASGLGDRSYRDEENFQISSTLNLHKFLPERHGWQIPVNVTVQNRVGTPRFSPRRGDITVDQEIEQIRQNPELSEEEKRREITEVRAAAETGDFSRTIRVPVSKRGSRSALLRHTIDGLGFTYTHSLNERRTPQREFDDATRWSSAMTYRLQVPRPTTVRPLWFLDELPVFSLVSGLRLNVVPQSVRLTADANRSINSNQDRARRGLSQDEFRRALEDASLTDESVSGFLRPINVRHTFGHSRLVEVQYSPFGFFSTGFNSRVEQSLDAAGIDPSSRLLVQLVSNPSTYATFEDAAFDDLFFIDDNGNLGPGFAALGITEADDDFIQDFLNNQSSVLRSYPVESIRVRPFTTVLGDVLAGERAVRTNRYQQTFNATLQSPFERVQAMRWLQITPISYASTFGWAHVPLTQLGVEDQASVSNLSSQATVRGGLRLRMRELSSKIGPLKRLDEAQREADQERRQRQQRFDADLNRYRQARQRVADAEAALRQAEAEAAESGEEVAENLYLALERAVSADTLALPRRPLPVPDPVNILRRTVLGVANARDLNITYDGSFGSTIGNTRDTGWGVLSSFDGSGAPLGFRLGLAQRFDATEETRFFRDENDRTFSFDDTFREEHRIGARTTLEFSPQLRVDLNFDTNFQDRETLSYSLDGDLVVSTSTESGRGQSSVMAFGGSYSAFLDRQIDRLFAAGIDANSTTVDTDGLTANAVAQDFRQAYVSGLGSFGPTGMFVIPVPNWSVTYSGIAQWPLIRSLTQSATLRHGYSATFDSNYRSFSDVAETRNLQIPRPGGGSQQITLRNEDVPRLRIEEPRLNQRFQPLIGVDLNFRAGIQANVNLNSSATRALSTVNARMTESSTDELQVRLSMTRTGFRLPLPFVSGGRLNNQLRLSLVLSRANNRQLAYNLRDDIIAKLGSELYGTALPETFMSPIPEATTRTTIEPQLSYSLSRTVTTSFFLRYEHFEAENSRIPTTTNINGGFNFRVSFSN